MLKLFRLSSNATKLWLVLLAGAAFGSSVVYARIALREIDPYSITVLRFAIASVAYLLTVPLMGKRFFGDTKRLTDVAIVGAIGTGLPLLLFYFALTFISSGIFSVLFAATPLVTAIVANFFLDSEKLNSRLLVGLIVSFSGVVFLIATRSSGLAGSFDIRGPLAVLAGVLMVAAGGVYARKRLAAEDPLVVSAAQSIAAFMVVTVVVVASGKWHLGAISPEGWFAIFYNGIVGSYIAFWLVFILVKKFGATASALPGYVMPVVSALLGAVMLGEVITLPLVIGALLILAGVFTASRKTESVPSR